jgi:hypothetical protein
MVLLVATEMSIEAEEVTPIVPTCTPATVDGDEGMSPIYDLCSYTDQQHQTKSHLASWGARVHTPRHFASLRPMTRSRLLSLFLSRFAFFSFRCCVNLLSFWGFTRRRFFPATRESKSDSASRASLFRLRCDERYVFAVAVSPTEAWPCLSFWMSVL